MKSSPAACLLALVVASCGACAGWMRPNASAPGIGRVLTSSARVRVLCDGKLVGYGSGVAVGYRHVLTARHVARACASAATFEVVFDDGSIRAAMVDADAPESVDVSRLVLDGVRRSWAWVARYRPRRGQRVWVYAGDGKMDSAHEWAFHLKQGWITHVEDYVIVVGIHAVPGNSGAAVFDDEGRVLGILVGGSWDPNQEFYLAAWRPTAWRGLTP